MKCSARPCLRCPKKSSGYRFSSIFSTAAPTPARCIRCRRRLQALLVLLMGSDPRGTPCLPGRSARTKHRYARGRIGVFLHMKLFPTAASVMHPIRGMWLKMHSSVISYRLLRYPARAAWPECCCTYGKGPDGICCVKILSRAKRSRQQDPYFIVRLAEGGSNRRELNVKQRGYERSSKRAAELNASFRRMSAIRPDRNEKSQRTDNA